MNRDDLNHFLDRVPTGVRGKYFVSDRCRDCGQCLDTAPDFFKADTELGHSYLYRQPQNAAEETLCRTAMEGCPTESIFDTGDRFDWDRHPPRNGDISKAA